MLKFTLKFNHTNNLLYLVIKLLRKVQFRYAFAFSKKVINMKNIVIAPCGNKSEMFSKYWLNKKENKNFDLCLLFYHAKVNDPALYTVADHFYHLKDFKYHMLYKLFTEVEPTWLSKYEYFYFLDDDIKIGTVQINKMFALSAVFESWISQAGLSKNSYCSWPMFKSQDDSFCRFVGQIEVMAPLFSAEALQKCLSSFIGNTSSWGIDSVWSKLLNYPECKLIVFDNVIMEHTQPVGGGELYQKIGIRPQEDWDMVIKKFDAKKQNYQEYGRLALINKDHYLFNFLGVKGKEFFRTIQRHVNDYDLPSRIQSQWNKWGAAIGKKNRV